jgi:hypothetical protein
MTDPSRTAGAPLKPAIKRARYHKHWSCDIKANYCSYDSAVVALFIMRRKIEKGIMKPSKNNRELHCYRCAYCDGWHIGHGTRQFYSSWFGHLMRELREGQSDWWLIHAAYRRPQ